MKINNNFRIRKIGGTGVAVPVGAACKKFKGAVKLNDSACFIWELMLAGKTESEIVDRMIEEYELTVEHARVSYRALTYCMASIGAVSFND